METILISQITTIDELDQFLPKLEEEEINNLKKDIKTNGVRDPLVLWKTTENEQEQHILLDGHNRYRILKQLHKDEAPAIYIELKDRTAAKKWMLNNQLSRRNLDVFTRVQLALQFEDEIKREAAARKKKGQFGGEDTDSQNSDEPVTGKGTVLEILAEKAATSKDTVYKIKKIVTKNHPRLTELVGANQLSINIAAQIAEMPDNEINSAINRALTIGKPEKMEQIEDRAPAFEGAGVSYKIRKSIVQFGVKEDGKPDQKNFIVGDDTLSGVCVRFAEGKLNLVQVPHDLKTFAEGDHFFIEDAMRHIAYLQNHLSVANDILHSSETVQKADNRANVKKRRTEQKAQAEAVAPVPVEKPAKAKAKAKAKKAPAKQKAPSKAKLVLMDTKKKLEDMLAKSENEEKRAELAEEIAKIEAQLTKATPAKKTKSGIDKNNIQEQQPEPEIETVPPSQQDEV